MADTALTTVPPGSCIACGAQAGVPHELTGVDARNGLVRGYLACGNCGQRGYEYRVRPV